LVLVVAAAAAYLALGGGEMAGKGRYRRVLVVGIDGMDPKITSKLMDEGRLPNFKMLGKTGTFMRLNTSIPPNSPVAWTSIATGSNPGKHSIFDFIIRDPRTYTPKLSLSNTKGGTSGTYYESFVTADSFWKITSDAGVPTDIVRWPVTFPPEDIKGGMLSGLGVPDIKGFLSGYTYYTSEKGVTSEKASNRIVEVSRDRGKISTLVWGPKTVRAGEIVDVTAPMEVKVSSDGKSTTLAVDGKDYPVSSGGWSGWVRAKFGVNMFKSVYGTFKAYLAGTDPFRMYVTAIQIDPENPVVGISKPDGYSGELARDVGLYYTLWIPEETDGYIDGRLDKAAFLAQVGEIESERDAMFWREFNLFMKRDSGIFAFVYDSSDRVQHMTWNQTLLTTDGDVVLDDAIIRYYEGKDRFIGEVLSRIDDKTLLLIISDHGFTTFERGVSMNRWLVDNGYMTLREEPPEGDDGGLFKYVDWKKTKAYSLGFNSIYVNAKGREGSGIVTDRKAVAREIARKLEAYTDPKSGRTVVYKAHLREDVYAGGHLYEAPDIIVGFYPGYRMAWQTAIGGLTPTVLVENTKKWRGDHLMDPSFVPGVLFSNVKIDRESASQMDVAPTVLDAVGVKVPESMDGRSLLTA